MCMFLDGLTEETRASFIWWNDPPSTLEECLAFAKQYALPADTNDQLDTGTNWKYVAQQQEEVHVQTREGSSNGR